MRRQSESGFDLRRTDPDDSVCRGQTQLFHAPTSATRVSDHGVRGRGAGTAFDDLTTSAVERVWPVRGCLEYAGEN